MKKRVLFIDRDGTLIVEPPVTKQVDSLELLEFLPWAISSLASIAQLTDYELVLVTNQDGLGTASFPEDTFWPAQNAMLKALKNEGVEFSEVCIDRSFEQDNSPTRKPRTGMLTRYMSDEYDLAGSFVIGDRATDLQLAQNLGCQSIFISPVSDIRAALSTTSWKEIERFVYAQTRYGEYERITSETSIRASVALYGTSRCSISTGLGFFDHMLNLLGSHAGFDMVIDAKGDLHVDEHHLIEDVGLVVGECIRRALRDRSCIGRFGFLLPMDESLAQIAVDLSGRIDLVWKADFRREMIGDMPTEMLKHFFKSLAESLKCNLHISVDGDNEHHKAEAIFKGVGRVLRSAVSRTPASQGIPSTKGVL